MKKNYYDILDEEERAIGIAIANESKKHDGTAMKAFEDQELKKAYAISVIDVCKAAKSACEAIQDAQLSLISSVHENIGKSPEYSMITNNTQAAIALNRVTHEMKSISAKRSPTECPECKSPMSVTSYKITHETCETKWMCNSGHRKTETKYL